MLSVASLYSSELNLTSITLQNADYEELQLLCAIRGLSSDGTESELRTRLEESEGLLLTSSLSENSVSESSSENAPTESNATINSDEPLAEQKGPSLAADSESFSLTILHSDTMERIADKNSNLVLLNGNVKVEFVPKKSGNKKTLAAHKVVIDSGHHKLSAMGNVTYQDSEVSDKSLQKIESELVVLDWSTGNLQVSGGNVSTTRTNSDDEEVTFYSYSSLLSYDEDLGSMILNDGYITSNPDTAYSSISADKIAILPYGDMFLKNAVLKIGRVPIMYFPYFFNPGAKLSGNPVVGMESTRGLFYNSTYEIFGSYPSFSTTDSTSFSSLLQSESDDETSEPDGPIYKTSKKTELTGFDKWVADTGSYFAFIFDAYQHTYETSNTSDNGSTVIGYDTNLYSSDKSLLLDSGSLMAYASDGEEGEITDSDDYPKFRYYSSSEFKFKTDWAKLDVTIPLYSDPEVLESYGNRLSTFSIDALWDYDLSFPSTYSSSSTTHDLTLTGNLDVPVDQFGPYIEKLSITSLSSSLTYKWYDDEDDGYDFYLNDITLPDIEAGMKGTLYEYSFGATVQTDDDTKAEEKSTTEETTEDDTSAKESSSYETEWGTLFAPSDETNAISSSSSLAGGVDLTYEINEDYSHSYSDLLYDDDNEENIDNEIELSLDLGTKINNYLIISNNMTANQTHSKDIYITDDYYNQSDDWDIDTTNKVQLPQVGLTYQFSSELYELSTTNYDGVESETEEVFAFTDDFVSKHLLSWSYTEVLDDGAKITPSVSIQLPPLDWELSPKIVYSGHGIRNVSSIVFATSDDDSTLELSEINNDFSLDKGRYSLSLDGTYDLEDDDNYENWRDPLDLTGKLSIDFDDFGELSQTLIYEGYDDDYSSHDCFSSIKTSYDSEYFDSTFSAYYADSTLTKNYWKNTVSVDDFTLKAWKNRVNWTIGSAATLYWDYDDPYSSYFTFSLDTTFTVAEVMKLKISLDSSNYGFNNYFDSDDNFDFSLLYDDFLRSLDIFGDGIYDTQFNIESMNIDFVHYMDDWNLHCKYSGSVVLSDYEYQWIPSFSVYIQWETIPELKVDKTIDYDGTDWEVESD